MGILAGRISRLSHPGSSLVELEENLWDIQQELESGAIPCVRQTGELVVP